ncbi:MAG: methionyl-tRNA formyltransferase [Candidatus Nomurabacteria bacterium]|nr:MAG: methionyl-tRNA formyltransferase [Candidatus Nomurabacteria bacterium]
METPSVVFLGSGEFGAQTLEPLAKWGALRIIAVVTQPDKPVGRAQTLTPNPVAVLAKRLGLPIMQPKKLDEVFAHWLQETKPDVAIVASYGKLIPEAVLNIPPKGFVNVHPSMLPKYRGASPVAGALLNGEKETGVSIMLLDKGLDTGPILQQESYVIPGGILREQLHERLAKKGAELLQNSLLPYLADEIQPTPQTNEGVSLTQILTREDGKIDWTKSAEQIYHQFQALHPWPGIWTTWNAQQMKLLDVQVALLADQTKAGATFLQDHTLYVQCGSGVLQLKGLQLAGKTPQSSESLLRGYPNLAHTELGK